MKTTIEHLLTPRFKVIADYPYNPHKIGDTLQAEEGLSSIHQTTISYTDEFGENVKQQNHCTVSSFQKYPHLFQLLPWWEERTKEEMPRYLKIDIDKSGDWDYYEVIKWDMEFTLGIVDDSNPRKYDVCDLLLYVPEYTYQPCSEEEYLANVKP